MKIYNVKLTKDDITSIKRGSTIVHVLENTSVKIEIKAEETKKRIEPVTINNK